MKSKKSGGKGKERQENHLTRRENMSRKGRDEENKRGRKK